MWSVPGGCRRARLAAPGRIHGHAGAGLLVRVAGPPSRLTAGPGGTASLRACGPGPALGHRTERQVLSRGIRLRPERLGDVRGGQGVGEKPQLTDGTTFRIPDHVLARNAGGELVLLNLDSECYHGLDPVGSRFWELIASGVAFGSAVTSLLAEYEVDRATLVGDLTDIVGQLSRRGLVVIE